MIPRLRDAFVNALGGPFPDTNVFLGPIVSGDPDDAVFIGYDGDQFGEMEVAVHTQQWGALGNKARDEEFDVRCCILNVAGAVDADEVEAAFTRLYAMYQAIAAEIHRDPSIGLGPPVAPVMVCAVRNFASYMPLTENGGVEPRISFSVHVRTRV